MDWRKWIEKALSPKDQDALLERFRARTGSYGYDPWGFHIKGASNALLVGRLLYEHYFRVEAVGLENIPAEGRALIVANHSGQLPIDGFLLGYSLLTNPHAPRACKSMIERFLPTVPFLNSFLTEVGGVVGDPINCARMLEAEEAIIVFPEGARGVSKTIWERYELQRFGTGFMHLAVNHETPVIPVGIVGCEESVVSLANFRVVAERMGLPALPLVVPAVWPTKVIIHFGKPMYFRKEADREELMVRHVRDVKQAIRDLLRKGLDRRKGVFGI